MNLFGDCRKQTYLTGILYIMAICLVLILLSPAPMVKVSSPPQRKEIVRTSPQVERTPSSSQKKDSDIIPDLAGPLSSSTHQFKPIMVKLPALDPETSRDSESYPFVNFTDSVKNLTSPVLLTTTNHGFLPLLYNLLISIQRLSIQPTILILCEEKAAYVELLKRQGHFSLNYQLALTHLNESESDPLEFNSAGYKSLAKKRGFYIDILVQRDLDVLYVDLDIVLLADPFKYFADDNYDIFYQWDKNTACAGFFYMRANQASKEFVEVWQIEIPKDEYGNQRAFNAAIRKRDHKIRVNGLPKILFMARVEFEKLEEAWYLTTPQPVMVHANFMSGKKRKSDWFKKNELWFLKD